jgi:hypothetical protein
MNGQRLFEIYKQKLADEGVDMDGWNDLEDSDRNAWIETAEHINECIGLILNNGV